MDFLVLIDPVAAYIVMSYRRFSNINITFQSAEKGIREADRFLTALDLPKYHRGLIV
jgi:hypothetical protein